MKKLALLFAALLLTGCAAENYDVTEAPYTTTPAVSESVVSESITTAETIITTTTEETSTPTETSETSSTEEAEEEKEVIEILELPEGYTRSYIMPENMEFSLELKDITPETDLFALTNMKKYPLGEKALNIDLDGDGTDEEFSLAEYHTGEWRVLQAVINGISYNLDMSYDEVSDNTPDEIFFCDIDSSDNYTEISCCRSVMTNDFYTSFYRYENGDLQRIFDISYDTPDGNGESDMFFDEMNASVTGKPIITDGSGAITAARRLDSQTWLAYSHYIYDSESGNISLVCEPVYPYYYDNIYDFSAAKDFMPEYYAGSGRPITKLLHEITIHKDPDTDSEVIILSPQEAYFTAEYPYPSEEYENGLGIWVHVIAEDGTHGWLDLPDGRHLEEANSGELVEKVFSVLVLYD